MSKPAKFINARRRGFLQGSAIAGGAVAAGVTLAESPLADNVTEPLQKPKHAGYRATDRVRRYYAKARF